MSRGATWAIVPVKALADAKQRLARVLPLEARRRLMLVMLEDGDALVRLGLGKGLAHLGLRGADALGEVQPQALVVAVHLIREVLDGVREQGGLHIQREHRAPLLAYVLVDDQEEGRRK